MHASFKSDVLKYQNIMNFKIRGCKLFRPRLDMTELLIHVHTRGETTNGAKLLVRPKRPGDVLGAKRLGEEMVWGRNVPDSSCYVPGPKES